MYPCYILKFLLNVLVHVQIVVDYLIHDAIFVVYSGMPYANNMPFRYKHIWDPFYCSYG